MWGKVYLSLFLCLKESSVVFKKGDTVSVNGFVGEVISLDGDLVEVLFGGNALHYCVEMVSVDDVVLVSSYQEDE